MEKTQNEINSTHHVTDEQNAFMVRVSWFSINLARWAKNEFEHGHSLVDVRSRMKTAIDVIDGKI